MTKRPDTPPLNPILLKEFLQNISARQLKLILLWSPPNAPSKDAPSKDAPSKDAMENHYGESHYGEVREILKEAPGLQEYCAVNRLKSVIFACKGNSWEEEQRRWRSLM